MEFRTIVPIEKALFQIDPLEEMLFVGSCFADSIGRRFVEDNFRATVNPFGVMYNPASVFHTIERCDMAPRTAVFTLGTNHVYRLKETSEIVDNCEKRPARLFEEEELSIDACAYYLLRAVNVLRQRRPDARVILTVSPIRYRKYGYHESQLSKAALLLAIQQVLSASPLHASSISYFPAYEIMMDELRDYRFYTEDMLHPSAVAIDYIWECLVKTAMNDTMQAYLQEYAPIRSGLLHAPNNPDSASYKMFRDSLDEKAKTLKKKYNC